jgi:hypothetical protein
LNTLRIGCFSCEGIGFANSSTALRGVELGRFGALVVAEGRLPALVVRSVPIFPSVQHVLDVLAARALERGIYAPE